MKNIFEDWIDQIINTFLEYGQISNSEIDIYRFGIEITLLKVIHFISYLFLSVYMNKVGEFFLIFLVFYICRRNVGGFHCKTRWGCYLFSCGCIFVALCLTDIKLPIITMIIIGFVDLIIMLLLTPVQNENRELDMEEIMCLRKNIKILTVIFILNGCVMFIMKENYMLYLCTIGLSLSAFLALLGKLHSKKWK